VLAGFNGQENRRLIVSPYGQLSIQFSSAQQEVLDETELIG
jgi:hypothetical protein